MTPYRSRPYLDLAYAPHARCMACGGVRSDNRPIDPAHYSGLMAHRLGKGGAQKSFDVASCPLCRFCHTDWDQYVDGNSDARALDFALWCLQWLHMNLAAGHVELVVHTEAVKRDLRPSRERKRRQQHSTATPAKVFPRPPSGFAR